MVEPNTLIDQIEADEFRADVCLAVVVSVESFDAVKNGSSIKEDCSSLFQDYIYAHKDAAILIEALSQIGVEGKKTKIYDLRMSLTEEKISEQFHEIE